MLSRQAICTMLASAATILAPLVCHAQTATIPPVTGRSTAPIIPVSLKNDQVAATVDGEKILVGDVRKILDAQLYPVTLSEEQKKELREKTLKSLIDDALMRHYLAKHAAAVGQAEFNKEYNDLAAAVKKEGKTMEQFHKESGQSPEELRRDIIALLQWRNVLERYYPEDKTKAYYDANKVFFDKVLVRASHILIKLPADAKKEQRDQATQQLLVWRQEILAGKAKFEDIAKQHSACPSKEKGGDVGQFRWKFDVVPEFSRAAYSMKPGEISGVVNTTFGVHLILVTERTPAEPSNYAAIKDAVREIMAKEEDLTPRILAEQRKTSEVKVNLR
jgi:parvulin-like peptidyl-prolyl isomerase